jgi:uncharacterized membrane protein YfcA
VVALTAAAVQGTVGVGFAMIAVPILSLLDPRLAPVPEILVILPLTIVMAWKERHAMDLHGVGWIIAGRFPGAAIGVALLAVATRRTLDIFIGIVVLAAVAIIGTSIRVHRTPATKFGAGVAAGTTGLVSSIGGPPVALLYSAEEAARIRSTLAAIFTIGVSITVTVRVATGNVTMTDLEVSAFLFPAVVIGYLVSLAIKDRIPRHAVRASILIVSALAGVALIGRAVAG